MKSKQLLFFACAEDMIKELLNMEEFYNIKYYKTGLSDENLPMPFDSLAKLPNFGLLEYGDWNLNPTYLLMQKELTLNVRPIPQRKGGMKYAIDQEMNQESCYLRPSGQYDENVLVAGLVGTMYETDFSKTILNSFRNYFKKEFVKIDHFYVGKAAREKMNSGYRLVQNVKFPIGYDLRELRKG